MTSILFLIETIYSKISRCIYVRNKKHFLNFFLKFWNSDSILNIFKKRWPSQLLDCLALKTLCLQFFWIAIAKHVSQAYVDSVSSLNTLPTAWLLDFNLWKRRFYLYIWTLYSKIKISTLLLARFSLNGYFYRLSCILTSKFIRDTFLKVAEPVNTTGVPLMLIFNLNKRQWYLFLLVCFQKNN